MTLAHKTSQQSKPHKGFTLMEIIVTLAIISVMIGGAVIFLSQNNGGALAALAQKTQILAKETLRDAKLNQRPYTIHISTTAIWAQAESTSWGDSGQPTDNSSIEIPEGCLTSFRASSTQPWQTIQKNSDPFLWSFSQTGLCEAISLKFENEDSVYEMSFHPLTAGEITDAY